MAKALFLDRDGTLIVDRVYLAEPAGVELLPGVTTGLRRARELGYRLFLFSNQSGIGRGYFTLADTERVNARMEELIALPSPLFVETCIAPERPDEPRIYRKPSPRFILEMLAKHTLEAADCWMVGDSAADVGAAQSAGIRVAILRTGRGNPDEIPEVRDGSVPVFADLGAFAATLA